MDRLHASPRPLQTTAVSPASPVVIPTPQQAEVPQQAKPPVVSTPGDQFTGELPTESKHAANQCCFETPSEDPFEKIRNAPITPIPALPYAREYTGTETVEQTRWFNAPEGDPLLQLIEQLKEGIPD